MAAMLRSRLVLRSLALRHSSTLRQPLYRRPLSQRVPEPMEFIDKHWADLTSAQGDSGAARAARAAVKVEGKEEDTESQKWERVRMLIQKHLEENPMPMSPVRAYYVLRRELLEIMQKDDAPSHGKAQKVNEKALRPRKPGEKRNLPSGHGRQRLPRLGAADAPVETMRASGRRSAKQSKSVLTLQRLQSQQSPSGTEAVGIEPEVKAVDKSQDPAVKEAAETRPEEKATDKSQDPAVKEAAETKPEEEGVDQSQALKSSHAKIHRAEIPSGRSARRQQAEVKKLLAELRERQLQGDYAKFNEFVLDRQAKPIESSIFSDFIKVYQEERYRKRQKGLRDRLKRKTMRKSFGTLNRGYEEPEEEYEAEEEEFQDEWRDKSILEDYWKAEQYRALHQRLREDLPERQPLAAERLDRMADVVRSAFCKEYADQHRPVLTHELADYENPYMLKRSAMERLLHERCVRNQLDERMMPRLLDQHADLVKLRRQAALPPEALEPLAAFRGDVRWHFDARQRLEQKLQGVDGVLEVIEAKDAATVDQLRDVLPEKRAENPPENQLEGVRHPWRNHLGFESAVPRGVAGGTKFGQPEPELATQLAKMRYPTLQRVAHTLPKDPKYRAHVVRSIRVLERSKHWDFQSKLDAINRMKEIYDSMKDSQEYMSGLDEKLVVNRVPSHIKRKYAADVQYVKHYPKMWYKNKSFFRYRPSLTATAPLGKKKK